MDIKDIIKRIHENEEFYMLNFLKIRTKEGKLVNFKLNPAQKKCLDIIRQQKKANKPIRVIWLKARQLGISTFCEGLIFHDTANNPFRNSMIIAHEDKATQNLFSMSKLFHEELPPAIRPMKKYSNESALTFENPTNNDNEKYMNPGLRSKITVATAKNVQTARSNTIHNLHASEVAFWDDATTLMTGMLQCIPDTPNSMVFIESTANGVGGWFYDFWKRSERGETDYIPIFLAWFDNPDYSRDFATQQEKAEFIAEASKVGYDSANNVIKTEELMLKEQFDLSWEQLHWRKWCINNKCNGDLEQFHQEYPSTPDEAFIVSGRPVFPAYILKEYEKNIKKPERIGDIDTKNGSVYFVDNPHGNIMIWQEPRPGQFYVSGADVAEGLSHGDYSVNVILDDKYNLCAVWHGHTDPDLFGEEIVKMAKYYNDAYVGVEVNMHGGTTLRRINELEYYNIYYQKNYSKISGDVSQKPGWLTNQRTKPLMINTLIRFVREKWLGAFWDTFISECFTYTKDDDGKTNAQVGCHDDTIMAMAIALQLLLENYDENYVPEIPKDQKRKLGYDDENYGEELGVDNSEIEEYTI
jgi:hypothetical protein